MSIEIRFIDLFAGIGGMRLGLENACQKFNIKPNCVLTSEIKPHAIETYQYNFKESNIYGDLSQISSSEIPDFDILLAGFPCQPFSTAGTRQGFLDTRGTLFFEIERILEEKKPFGFLLENVDNLVKHDRGRTFKTIIYKLEQLDYKVTWKVLNAKDFRIPQDRKRIYIAGTKNNSISLEVFPSNNLLLKDILQSNQPTLDTPFVKKILSLYSVNELHGKAIKDKRGGDNNIHSWDLEIKGEVSQQQKELLNKLLKERRKKIWAAKKGIVWMDGMPLTIEEILTFFSPNNLFKSYDVREMLDDLVRKGYLKFEYPKDLVETVNKNGKKVKRREYRTDLPKGYNIVVGKLSFEISKILDPKDIAPTLVATDMNKLAVVDGNGIRQLTITEGLRLFGFPESYKINLPQNKAFDLLGNTVVVPIIQEIAYRILVQKLMSIPNQSYNFCLV
ncbi:MAG: DNA (cytosine-5-)-methyltransferase [Xenococcaceae cyanobacterium MO_207.B15]|nr:DNA (cytosine-5-)-methyltransferase [Xenococcaceae cyanobacterium MO_207.B15]